MTGSAVNRSGQAGINGPGASYFYFSYYYFTAVCPAAEEDLS